MPPTTTHIVCVGAVYIDTIWTVPYFPKEDTKLRAQKVTRRREGNTTNTLEALSDILSHALPTESKSAPQLSTKLHVIAALPDEQSQDAEYIKAYIPHVHIPGFYRQGHQHAASSMIIQSEKDGTRTIVSHGGDLPEMTCEEFVQLFRRTVPEQCPDERAWVHFEDRDPEMVRGCVRQLRAMRGGEIVISVECEKPDRKWLGDAAKLAKVTYPNSDPTKICFRIRT